MKKYTQPVAEEMNMMVARDVNDGNPSIGNQSGKDSTIGIREREFGSSNFDDDEEEE